MPVIRLGSEKNPKNVSVIFSWPRYDGRGASSELYEWPIRPLVIPAVSRLSLILLDNKVNKARDISSDINCILKPTILMGWDWSVPGLKVVVLNLTNKTLP